MIRHPGRSGVAFTEAREGNQRQPANRARTSAQLGLDPDWATVVQVHGSRVLRVDEPGEAGEADALWTTEAGLPLAVLTADCYGVVVGSDSAAGVAHSGWRGTRAGVVAMLVEDMTENGHRPTWAALGPGIEGCCFEVGQEVVGEFASRHRTQTTWGSTSIDLAGVIVEQLDGLETWSVDSCTMSDEGWFSYRRDATPERLATVAWIS